MEKDNDNNLDAYKKFENVCIRSMKVKSEV